MEKGEQQSSRKERPELTSGGQLKEEVDEGEVTGEGATAREELTLRLDKAKLHCPVCTLPMKPPIFEFQCDARHLACGTCHGSLPKNQCYACGGAGAYGRNTPLEDVIRAAMVSCPNDIYGCRSSVAYFDADGHQRECPCAPCGCPEAGCTFVGSPPMLVDHLKAAHSCPAVDIRYGEGYSLRLLESQPRLLLVADDGRAFLVSKSVSVSVAAHHGVSLACVRANAAVGPQYTCKMVAIGNAAAATGKLHFVLVDMEVPSTAAPGEEEEASLVVQRKMLHGPAEEIHLNILIDKALV